MRACKEQRRNMRPMTAFIGLAAGVALSLSAAQSANAAEWTLLPLSPGSALPLYVGGLFGGSASKATRVEVENPEIRPAGNPRPEDPGVNPLEALKPYLPKAGEWRRIPGLEFNNYRLPNPEALALGIRGTQGSVAVLSNQTGAAFDPEGLFWYFWGGGADVYGGNEVYRLDLSVLQMSQINAPSFLDKTVKNSNGQDCLVPSDGPASASTYDGFVWSPATQSFFVLPSGEFCAQGNLNSQTIWEFEPLTGTWTAVAQASGITGPVHAEYDSVSGHIFYIETGNNAQLREFNPVTGQLGAKIALNTKLTVGSTVLDRQNDQLVLFAAEGAFAISLNNLGTITRLADVPSGFNTGSGAAFDIETGLIVLWDGTKDVRTFDVATGEWTKQTPASGPAAGAGGVFSKWIVIEELGVFAGYQNPAEGFWLYRLPSNLTPLPPAPVNKAPIADAGTNQLSVQTGNTANLNGSGSYDPDGDALTYNWSVVTKPSGSSPTLSNANKVAASFTTAQTGTYVVRLTVSDGKLSDSKTVNISVTNPPPPPNPNQYNLYVSSSPNRGSPLLLQGQSVLGNIYVYTGPDSGVASSDANQVAFYLDDPNMTGSPIRTEKAAPYDFGGGTNSGSANPFDASALSAGTHTITAALPLQGGGKAVTSATFTVAAAPSGGTGGGSTGGGSTGGGSTGGGTGGSGGSNNVPNPGNLSKLAAYLPAPGQWSLVPNTAFRTWTDGCDGTPGDKSGPPCSGSGSQIAVTYAEANAIDPAIWGTQGSFSIPEVWNSAAYDPVNHRMYFMGGGHLAYYGNEVYELDLERLTLTRMMNPAPLSTTSPSGDPFPSSGPLSVHNYDALVWSEATQSMFSFQIGGLSYENDNKVAEFKPSTRSWTLHNGWNTNLDPHTMSAYNPTTKTISMIHGRGALGTVTHYDPVNKQWIRAAYQAGSQHGWMNNGVGNYFKNEFYVSASTAIYKINPANDNVSYVTDLPSGLSYQAGWDVRGNTFVFWGGNKDVWIYDTVANTWRQENGGGAKVPTDPFTGEQRVFKKWRYVADLDAFVGYYDTNEGLWLYCAKDGCNTTVQPGSGGSTGGGSTGGGTTGGGTGGGTGGSGTVSADYTTRCADANVIQCVDFDTQSEVNPYIYCGFTCPEVDNLMTSNGSGSLKMTVPPFSPADTSGAFSINFSPGTNNDGTSPSYPVQFGEGQEFYVQWRQRFSPEMISNIYNGAEGWKQIILGEGDRPGSNAFSCTELEVVVTNQAQRGFPQMYHSCGVKDGQYQNIVKNVGAYDFDLQPSSNCLYSQASNPQEPPCALYHPNEWMTFQVHVKIGTWYKNDGNYCTSSSRQAAAQSRGISSACSTIELWVAREGQPSRQAIKVTDYDLVNVSSNAMKYGAVWLLPYNTRKSSAQDHPTAYTWYDDLIISRARIADPSE